MVVGGWGTGLTFGMLHLILEGDRAPPLHSQVVPRELVVGGAVHGEVLQQHHVGA